MPTNLLSQAVGPDRPETISNGDKLMPLALALEGTDPEYLTTMPLLTEVDQMMIYDALNGEHRPIKSVINLPISVVGWVIRPSDPKVSPDGEMYHYPIIVLICEDGTMVRASSTGVARCVRAIAKIKGCCPWTPPVKVIPRGRDIGNGQQWFWLELVRSE